MFIVVDAKSVGAYSLWTCVLLHIGGKLVGAACLQLGSGGKSVSVASYGS